MSARALAVSTLLLLAGCARDTSLPDRDGLGGFISGTAVSADPATDQETPVPLAEVSVVGSNHALLTDASGAFTLGPIPPGAYKVLVRWQDPQGTVRQRLLSGVKVIQGATSTVGAVSLRQNASVSGRVLLGGKESGNIGAYAYVPGMQFTAPVADNGTYLLRGLPEGELRVEGFKSGHAASTTELIALRGGVITTAPDLVLTPAQTAPTPGSVSGRVAVSDSSNFGGVAISAWPVGATSALVQTTSEADGAFTLGGLPGGLYELRFELAGYPQALWPNQRLRDGEGLTLPSTILLVPAALNKPPENTPPPADGGSALPPPPCSSSLDCGPGLYCADGACRPGQCGTAADCGGDKAGMICEGGSCVPCGGDPECGGNGKLCADGRCVVGNCHDTSDCAPTDQVCDTTSHFCQACGTGAFATAVRGGCEAGNVCDRGVCAPGNCLLAYDCPVAGGFQTCQSFQCTACTLDAQCPGGHKCNASGVCVPGTCRSNTECPATQVCTNFNCVGNCRTNADCPGTSGFCGPGNVCTACATDVECGGGRVCGTGGQAGQCVQVAPAYQKMVGLNLAGGVTDGQVTPRSGATNAYVMTNHSTGVVLAAIDRSTSALRWQREVGPVAAVPWAGGVAVPARGMPGDEVFVGRHDVNQPVWAWAALPDGSGTPVNLWKGTIYGGPLAAGLINGSPVVVWLNNSFLNVVDAATGAALHTNKSFGCTPNGVGAPVFGTELIFVACPAALVAINPLTGAVAWTFAYPDGATFTNTTGLSLYRPPTATVDWVYVAGTSTLGSKLYAINAHPTAPSSLFTVPVAAFDALAPVLIDREGNALYAPYSAGNVSFLKVDTFGRELLGGTTNLLDSSHSALGADGSLIGYKAGKITAVALVGGTNTSTINWQIAPPSGGYRNNHVVAPALDGGAFYSWVTPATGTVFDLAVLSQVNGPLVDGPPAWPMQGGNSAGHYRAPAYECQVDADCTPEKGGVACVMNQCVGNCLTAADCAVPEQGCHLNRCGRCVNDAACGAGRGCVESACYEAPECRVNLDCGTTSICVAARCKSGATIAFANPSTTATVPTGSAIGPSGRIYVVSGKSPDVPTLQAYDRNGTALWATPVPLTGVVTGTTVLDPLVTQIPGEPDEAVFWWSDASNKLVKVSAGPTGGTSVAIQPLGNNSSVKARAHLTLGVANGRQTLFAYSGNNIYNFLATIFAVDAELFQTLWTADSVCGMSSSQHELLVGTDGTVYAFCDAGVIQAWDPAGSIGNKFPPVAGNAGQMLWQTADLGNLNMHGAPAIVRLPGKSHDVIYFVAQTGNGMARLFTVPVGRSGYGTSAGAGAPPFAPGVDTIANEGRSLVVRPNGDALFVTSMNGTYLFTPTGKVKGYFNYGNPNNLYSGYGAVLADDGMLYFVQAGYLNGVHLSATEAMTTSFRLLGPGNTAFAETHLLLSPSPAAGVPVRLLSDVSSTTANRSWVGVDVGASTGLQVGGWPTLGGDQQRRFSLKPQ